MIFEALLAKHGDSLLLHSGTEGDPQLTVIDGGPPGVFNAALRPRLDQLRAQRHLEEKQPLPIDLMMVSHIDDDHISGLLELVRKLRESRDSQTPPRWKVRRFWHNSFDDILGEHDPAIGSSASAIIAASAGQPDGAFLASVKQGRELRGLLKTLNLAGNPPFGGLIQAGEGGNEAVVGDLKFTVVSPDKVKLLALQEKWDKEVKPLLKKEKNKAEAADYVDRSVHNLSSIVVLVESQNKRILLTGDGRGDHTLEGLEAAGLVKEGKLEVDILKVPHHGSDRDVEPDYFQTIVADHYVISADGKHGNPDIDTLRMISAARPDDRFTIHLTYPLDQFNEPSVGKEVAEFFDTEKGSGRKYQWKARGSDDLSIAISLV